MQTGEYNDAIAILLMRTVTGILFFFQGYDKLFNVKIDNVVRTFSEPLSKFRFSSSILKPCIALSSVIEMVCGVLLFIGLGKNISLYLLAMDLIFISFIFSSMKAMWDMQFFFPRLLLIVILLFCLPEQDLFSLDTYLGFVANSGK